jgi:cytochrome c-type biogenesis protein CcmH/NrfG
LLRLGQNDEGQRLMREAIATSPQDVDATEFYATGLPEDLTRNQAQARRDFQRALEMNP